jgi:gamma-tubulin complex component 5
MQHFINEVDAVREVLIMMQGCQSCLFESQTGGRAIKVCTRTCLNQPLMLSGQIISDRRIIHLTRVSQISILGSFAVIASTLNSLRHLVHNATPAPPKGRCRTFEAFLAAIGRQLHDFDMWCARKEQHIGLAQQGNHGSDHVVSLLSLQQEASIKMAGTFVALLDVARNVETKRDHTTPSALSALILNTLLEAIRTRLTAGDTSTAKTLTVVWQESAEPLWSNLEKWLRDGIPIRAGFEYDRYTAAVPTWDVEEFFIRINPLIDIGSPDFWDGSYTLPPRHSKLISGSLGRESPADAGCVPAFLIHVVKDILAAGKAVGLLRAIDMTHLVGDDWLGGWIRFKHLTKTLPLEGLDWDLENLISDTLLPPCRLAQSLLRQVLVEECELWKHLQGLENVCLMSRGDAMSQFSEKLFARVRVKSLNLLT